jgi:hypothetical protein
MDGQGIVRSDAPAHRNLLVAVAEAKHDEGAAFEVVGLLPLVNAGLGVREGGVDQPLPVPLRLVLGEGERGLSEIPRLSDRPRPVRRFAGRVPPAPTDFPRRERGAGLPVVVG